MSGTEKKYGKFKKFIKPEDIPSSKYSEAQIAEKLANYREDSILNIPQHTHVRFYSAVRDYKTKAIVMSGGKPKVTFKPGGFIKSKNVTVNPDGSLSGYVVISDTPYNDHTKVAQSFSVQVEPTTKFFRIRSKNELEEEANRKKEEELAKMKEIVEKAKREKEEAKEIKKKAEKKAEEKDDEIERLKQEIKKLKKESKKL